MKSILSTRPVMPITENPAAASIPFLPKIHPDASINTVEKGAKNSTDKAATFVAGSNKKKVHTPKALRCQGRSGLSSRVGV